MTLKRRRLSNGKYMMPPKGPGPFGAWVEVSRRPLPDMVEFTALRSETVSVYFFDEVYEQRMWKDGTIEGHYRIVRLPQHLDARHEDISYAETCLLQAGHAAARGLRVALESRKVP